MNDEAWIAVTLLLLVIIVFVFLGIVLNVGGA